MVLTMKNRNLFLFIFSILFIFTSCENEIKVTVKPGPERLVVDAFVNNLLEKQTIRITKSIPYFNQPGTEPAVTGATVAIVDTTDGNTKLFVFADSGMGNYIFKPNAITGDTFTLNHPYILLVVEGTDTLISASILKPTAKIDSLKIVAEDGSNLGFRKGNFIELAGKDLVGLGNTYWIKTYRNDSFKNKIDDLNLAFDMSQSQSGNQDGGEFIWPIRYAALNDFGRPWKKDEKARVEILSISYEAYAYFNLIISENQNGGLFATPPVNIFTNIFNFNTKKIRALGGFFCMSAVSRVERVMP